MIKYLIEKRDMSGTLFVIKIVCQDCVSGLKIENLQCFINFEI